MASKRATLSDIGENAFLRRVAHWFGGSRGADVSLGIGDDCCALSGGKSGESFLLSTDALIEGVHFRRDWAAPRQTGARALALNLSDLAAMGARPVAALLALSVPSDTELNELGDFFRGLRAMAKKHGCALAGGDLTRAPQWSMAVTVVGRPAYKNRVVTRDAARPGMTLYCTGQPGEAAAGCAALYAGMNAPKKLTGRYFIPTPRLAEATALARACNRLAMLDLSDGVWSDAGQIASASGVGVEILRDALPVSTPMRALAERMRCDPLDWALFGGESCELLFATDEKIETIRRAFGRAGLATPVHAIGRIVAGRGERVIGSDGRALKIRDKTYVHFGGAR